MHSLTMFWLPIVSLAILWCVGAGPAAVLGVRIPLDARAALALPLGAAVLACSSALLIVHVPVKLAISSVLVVSVAVGILVRKHIPAMLGAAKVPLAVAAASLLFVSIPWIAMGSWEPAAYGNADSYEWVSQAKAYLDGAAPPPVSTHPDRGTFELVSKQHWPVALAFGVSGVAWLSGSDPALSYSAFAVILVVLLALTVYLVGRAVLDWSGRKAAAAALLVTTSEYLLFATYYGWQAQLVLTAFSIASVTFFRLALEPSGGRREVVLAGLFAAAAVATYGTLVMAFVPLFAFVLAGFALRHRMETSPRALVRVVLETTAAAATFGLIPIVWAGLSFADLTRSLSLPLWNLYSRALVPDALGLVPRPSVFFRSGIALTIMATVVAVAIGAALARQVANGATARLGLRHDFLLAGAAYFVLALFVLLLPGISPYWSIKIAGYGAPILILTAFAILAAPRPSHKVGGRLVTYTRLAAAILFVIATTDGVVVSLRSLDRSRLYAGLAAQVAKAGGDTRVQLDVGDGWRQSWVAYYLRDTPLIVPHPTVFLNGWGAYKPDRRGVASYRLAVDKRPGALWYGGGLALRPVR